MSATYFLRTNPFELTINERIERDLWTASIPSKCQDCHQPMDDNTRPAHLDCEQYRLEHYKNMVTDSKPIFVENVCGDPECENCGTAEHETECMCEECAGDDREWDRFKDTATAEEMAEFVAEMEAR